MGVGKNRWKISFHRSSPALKPERKKPPKEFVCSISGSLMADPVIVASGQTFERNCVQVCKKLGFSPVLSDGSRPDFSTVIPNMAIKATILDWCDSHGVDRPKPIEFAIAEKFVCKLMASQGEEKLQTEKKVEVEDEVEEKAAAADDKIEVSEKELLEAVAENPQMTMKLSHASTEVNRRRNHFYSSSSESVTPTTPLTLATRPSCYSPSSSSSSSSSEIVTDETSSEEDQFVAKLKSCQVFEQEEAAESLRKLTRTNEASRISLCTPRLLSALRPLLISRYSAIQTNSVAALVNLSLQKTNKVKIVRAGIVPFLIDLLKGGFSESQEHAAGALFSLALDDENKMAIGVLGALQPLLHILLRSESQQARQDSALALYHLSLVQSNRSKLVKLGAVPLLLTMVKSGGDMAMASRALLILCNLAACAEGRSAMLDAGAVECFVGMLRREESELESGLSRESCLAGLYALSQGSLRFRGLAKEAGAVEVLRKVAERGSERGREKAKKILQAMMRGGGNEREEAEEDWEGLLNSGVVSRNRYRIVCGEEGECANSSGF